MPRVSLIEDLENILPDAINRYGYFQKTGWEEETHSFVLHALFLLKEIKAEESLPKIFSFLEYDNEFIEFWIGDHITETLWQCIYTLGFANTALLKQFLLQPGIDTYSKTAVSEALTQMLFHHPERKNEILSVYYDVLTRFSQANIDENLIDSDFLGLAICDIMDCNFHELLPLIKALYEKGYVSIGICGNYRDVEKDFGAKRDNKRTLFTIFELYNDVLSNWAGYNENEDTGWYDWYDNDDDNQAVFEQAVSNKIGRNEPCPCGSGKKYKKCCFE